MLLNELASFPSYTSLIPRLYERSGYEPGARPVLFLCQFADPLKQQKPWSHMVSLIAWVDTFVYVNYRGHNPNNI